MSNAPDSSVDTKCRSTQTFGNDGNGGTDVDTKCVADATFGNDAVGFVRVRKRKLKGGQPSIRALPSFYGERGTSAMSFDLVRAVRVGGKPRHEFVLGLGSQKNIERDLCWFWAHAVHRMVKHGLAEDQRRRVIAEMVRKGARLPTTAQCKDHARNWPHNQAEISEIIRVSPPRRVPEAP
jgi:hypothetical protein